MKILSLLGFLLVFLSASAAHAQMSGADMYNPASSTTTGGGSVTWPTTGDIVISNSTNSPAGLAEVDGECAIGSGGVWVAGSCSGGASPAGQLNAIQAYATSTTFAGSSSGNGLYRSTTSQGLIFLSATTTANLLSLGDNGADVTSYALGESALLAQSTTNLDNTAIGGFSLAAVTTGSNNTALGWDAGKVITTGSNNTIIGALVGSTTLTTGTDNILIGVNNAIDVSTSSTSNNIVIGGSGGPWVSVSGTNTTATESTAMQGSLVITSTSANAFAVGPTGSTNPVFSAVANTTSGVTGISVTNAAAGGPTVIQPTDSAANSALTIQSKGTGTLLIQAPNSNGQLNLVGGSSAGFGLYAGTPGGSTERIALTNSSRSLEFYVGGNSNGGFGFNAPTGAGYPTTENNFFEFVPTGTITHNTGTLSLQRDFLIEGLTHAFAGSSTLTSVAALGYLLPGCGTNATCTNLIGIYHGSTALTVTGTAINSYPLYIAADTGATNNYAAYLGGAVGIGTTAPTDLLDIAGGIGLTTTTATLPLNGAYSAAANELDLTTSGANALRLTAIKHISYGGSAPVVSACGTSPSIDAHATDTSGTVTVGTVSATSCTVTFANAYASYAHCRVTPETAGIVSLAYSYTTSAITITGTSLVGDVFDYECDGY